MIARNRLVWAGAALAFAVLALILVPHGTAADGQPAAPPGHAAAGPGGAPGAPGEDPPAIVRPKPATRFKDFAELTKDMQKQEGLFTLLHYDPQDKTHDPERLLAIIPRNLLDQDLLFATSIAGGGALTGFMWNDYLVHWTIAGDSLKLSVPNSHFVERPNEPITSVVQRTHLPEFITAVPIEALTPGGDVVIDLEKLLKSNISEIAMVAGGGIMPQLSTWRKVKDFPDNLLIEVELAVGSRGGGGQSVAVAYAFRRLPPVGSFRSRAADPRVGYFLTARVDWTKGPQEVDVFDRYIDRWKLEKRDADLELSPPKEPILFIIEDTVPIQWRRWVREGIESWNKAFEKIGFDKAIVVQQQTPDNEYASYDPEDARYNFFRWIVSGRAFAMGPSCADPRTGQILDADVIFDDSFVRAWMYDFDLFSPANIAMTRGPGLRNWLDANPDVLPEHIRRALAPSAATPEDQLWQRAQEQLDARGRCTCGYAYGMQQQIALGHDLLIASGPAGRKLPEKYIGEAIRLIVTHEIGHTLGLRHNFKASSWLPLDEVKRRRNETDEPTTGSVMDYNPLLFFAEDDPNTVRHFVTPTIGPYDEWAIAYGYAEPKSGQSEKELLKKITQRASERPLAYATDEDTSWLASPDPLVATYDMSLDPVAWARARTAVVDRVLPKIRTWAVTEDQPLYMLTRAFNVLLFERADNCDYVSRVVSGQYVNRASTGDPNSPPAFVLLDPAEQRAALKFLGETVLSDRFFDVDPNLLNNLPTPRWDDWGHDPAARLDYPIHDHILALQFASLLTLTAPPVLERVYDAELKSTAPDKFTAAELIKAVRDTVFAPLAGGPGPYTDAKPMISSVMRNLEREYLSIMLAEAQAPPGVAMSADLSAMVRQGLRELSAMIGTMNLATIDFGTRAHLTECKSRIDRVLEAQYQAK